jgi:hypothetical protein
VTIMPELKGTVRCVRVGDDFGFVQMIEQGTGDREIFILWWSGVTGPSDPPVHVRIIQSDWVSILRQAMASGLTVTITHPANSSEVENVQLGEF